MTEIILVILVVAAAAANDGNYECKEIVDQHLSKYDALMDQYQLVLETNAEQRFVIQSFQYQIVNGLQSDMSRMRADFDARIASLETVVKRQEATIQALSAQQTDIRKNVGLNQVELGDVKKIAESAMDNGIEKLVEIVEKQTAAENDIKDLRDRTNLVEQSVDTTKKEYFTANRYGKENVDPSDDISPFENVITQNGEGYNPTTGIFTAQSSGVYLFSYCNDHTDRRQSTYLMYNQDVLCQKGGNDNGQNNGCSAVLTLKRDDTVYVQVEGTIYGGNNGLDMIFTGVQLWATKE